MEQENKAARPAAQTDAAPQPPAQAGPDGWQGQSETLGQEIKQPLPSVTGRTDVLVECRDVVRTFYEGTDHELEVLHGINLKIYKGEFVAIVGQSGSGKSTLMNSIGALDKPTRGQVFIDGTDITTADETKLSALRCKYIGFVFQQYNLIQRTTACQNVELPMMYAKVPPKQRTKRAMELLKLVDMDERAGHMPSEMSGGQQQRVSIARAMANDPTLILADEPTGALDSETGHLVMDIFHKLHDEQGKTILFITHSPGLAEECERVVTIKDGRVIGDRKGAGRGARQY